MKQNNQPIKDNDMNKQKTTTTTIVEAIRELPLRIVRNGMLFAIGFFGTTILAVAISGTIKTWTTGEVLKSADLNTTITSLKTAIEGIPNWTKSGGNTYFTDGYVGIGTTSMPRILTVITGTTRHNLSGGALFTSALSATTGGVLLGSDNNIGYIAGVDGLGTTVGNLVLNQNGGNVGIGTAAPNFQLTIYGNDPSGGGSIALRNASSATNAATYLRMGNDLNETAFQLFVGGSGYSYNTQWKDALNIYTPHSKDINFVTSDTTRMTIKGSGNVGIGTASPSATLHVVGTTLATAWSTSDERYKKNIQTLQSPLEKILKLRGVNYEWRKDEFKEMKFKSGKDIGFIGQEVEKVLPEVIFKDEKGYISLAYSHILPVVVEAFKELKKDHDLVKAEKAANDKKLHALEEDNKRLRDTVETMRATSLQSTITSQRVQQLEDRLRAIENTQMARK